MGDSTAIRTALEGHLATCPGVPPTNCWDRQNVPYQPEPGTPWLRVVLATGFRDALTMPAENAWIQTAGLLMVDVFYPIGAGPDGPDGIADAIVAWFPHGQAFAVSGQTLWVTRSVAREGMRDEDWYHVPVEVGWTVATVNALV